VDAEKVIELLKCYTYNKERLAEIQEQLDSICPKLTPTYGNLAPAFSGDNQSKVEKQGNRDIELEQRAKKYGRAVRLVTHMIEDSGLTDREKELMWWIANNGRLAAYARREHIGKDNVYKIRDRAVNKILAAYKTQNVGYNYKKLR
jgi:DNA-binding CsgD family transcriptional regulator